MDTSLSLAVATGAEKLDGASLQPSIDALQATAKNLDADLATAPDVAAVQAIGKQQADLNDRALALVDAQIDLLAGQALVTAAHVNAAAVVAKAAIAEMTDWKKKVTAAGKLVDFFAAVLSGDGGKMIDAAYQLKDVL
jgi:hypothetical protein